MYVKRQLAGTPGTSQEVPVDPKFAERYPAMWEFLTMTTWEDGKERKPSKMSLSVVEGRWCVCFVDDASKRIAFLSGLTFQELLTSLEKRLASDGMEWRAAKQWGKKSS